MLKGVFHPKMKIVMSFTYLHIIPNLHDLNLILLSTDESKSHRYGTTCGWVNDNRNQFLGGQFLELHLFTSPLHVLKPIRLLQQCCQRNGNNCVWIQLVTNKCLLKGDIKVITLIQSYSFYYIFKKIYTKQFFSLTMNNIFYNFE